MYARRGGRHIRSEGAFRSRPPLGHDLDNASSQSSPACFTAPALDSAKTYTLSELVNIGEENNPETRVAWQNARARAAEVGIAESTLYPTLSGAALAKSTRFGMFYGTNFAQQTIETFSPVFLLDYIIFDFGQRSEQVAVSRSNLLAANWALTPNENSNFETSHVVLFSSYFALQNRGAGPAHQLFNPYPRMPLHTLLLEYPGGIIVPPIRNGPSRLQKKGSESPENYLLRTRNQ